MRGMAGLALRSRLSRIRGGMGPLWWNSALMFGCSRVGDLTNLYVALFLVPDLIPRDQLGAILPLTQLGLFVALPLSILGRTSMKYVNVFMIRGEFGMIKRLLRDLGVVTLLFAGGMLIYVLLLEDVVEDKLRIEDPLVMWLVAGIGLMSCIMPIVGTTAQGLKRFSHLIISRLLQPLVRLVVVVLLIEHWLLSGYLAGSFFSSLAVLLLMLGGFRSFLSRDLPMESYRPYHREMWQYLIRMGVMIAIVGTQKAAEPWVIRQGLSSMDSAGFYIAAMFGNIPLWVAPAMMPFLFSLVSERHEAGQSTTRLHLQSLFFVAVVGGTVAAGLAFGGHRLLMLRETWSLYADAYAGVMWKIALLTTGEVLLSVHILHENACRRFQFLSYVVPVLLLELLFLASAIDVQRLEWLPLSLDRSLSSLLGIMLWSRALVVCGIMLETAWGAFRRIKAEGSE